MSDRPGKKLFPNPFYVLLLVASTLFVVTALAYLVAPTVMELAAQAASRPRNNGHGPEEGRGAARLAVWLDRNGPLGLGVEFLAMLASALLAMATDRWYTPRKVEPRA
jgi:hypothetical protein